jgi:hypothetical protein
VIADFDVTSRDLSNHLDAYLRKVLMPLERIASAAAAAGAELIVFCRGSSHSDGDVRRAALLGESIALKLYEGREERLLVVRTGVEAGAPELTRLAEKDLHGGIAIRRAAPDRGGEGIMLEPVDTRAAPEDVSGVLIEISRALADGKDETISDILLEFARSAGVEEHERG